MNGSSPSCLSSPHAIPVFKDHPPMYKDRLCSWIIFVQGSSRLFLNWLKQLEERRGETNWLMHRRNCLPQYSDPPMAKTRFFTEEKLVFHKAQSEMPRQRSCVAGELEVICQPFKLADLPNVPFLSLSPLHFRSFVLRFVSFSAVARTVPMDCSYVFCRRYLVFGALRCLFTRLSWGLGS